jgi:preprotein translocase subunit YajC
MSRRIITRSLQSNGESIPTDGYTDKLIKYIPSDIVAAWLAVTGIISSDIEAPQQTLLWLLFAVFLVITFFWTLKQTAQRNKAPANTQSVLSTGSFGVWVFALGGPFATLSFYRPSYGSVILILYTLLVALVSPSEE